GTNYLWRGLTHYQLNDYVAALADLTRAVALQPENGGCYRWRGATHYLLNNATAALADFDRAIELQPEEGANYYWRGVVLAALGQQAESEAALQRAAACAAAKPDDLQTPRLYARLALLAGEPEAAYVHYREAMQREPGIGRLSRELDHLASIARAFPANAHIPAAQAWLSAQLAAIE
ncbi:MAG: tetratricopeptide repeat protein, partial [Chloroflexi bacterium SZAS-1]|nr:tetratricopeptide repeat protein [Chloroflexi bacterium SZAS-1]